MSPSSARSSSRIPELSKTHAGRLPHWQRAIVAGLFYLLFIEWLYPLLSMSEITELYMIRPFMMAFLGFVVIDFLHPPEWAGWLLKAIGGFALTGWLFHPDSLLTGAWFVDYGLLAKADLGELILGRPENLSAESRTLMFLAGWSIMMYVVYSSMMARLRAVAFVAATLGYLAMLQVWPGISTTAGMARSFAWGLLLLAALRLPRAMLADAPVSTEKAGDPNKKRKDRPRSADMKSIIKTVPFTRFASWFVAAGLVTSVFLTAAWTSAQHASGSKSLLPATDVWSVFDEWFGKQTVQATGYSSDDTHLGGALHEDAGIAFIARSERAAYWRGETKDEYTGQGWRIADAYYRVPPVPYRDAFADLDLRPETPLLTQDVTVVNEQLTDRLFTGGVIARVNDLRSGANVSIAEDRVKWDLGGGRYLLQNGTRAAHYSVSVIAPNEGAPQAEQAAVSDESLRELRQRYLQLPAELPDRVKELGQQIADGDDDYTRASAVEAYLRSHYKYRLGADKQPKDNQDFVDQFLFETKEGYCDHFSTAMAVLLRSAGIPARWVKGFAPGELKEGTTDTYIVRNLHAHAWVEAYINGEWIRFEPTPPYEASGGAVSKEGVGLASAGGKAAHVFGKEDALLGSGGLAWLPAGLAPRNVWGAASTAASQLWKSTAERLAHVPLMAWAGAIAALPLAGLLLRLLRGTPQLLWAPAMPGAARDPRAARQLLLLESSWRSIYRRLGPRAPHLTLREYAAAVPLRTDAQRNALAELALAYEAARFGPAAEVWMPAARIRELTRLVLKRA